MREPTFDIPIDKEPSPRRYAWIRRAGKVRREVEDDSPNEMDDKEE